MLLLMDPPHTYIDKTVLVKAEAKDGSVEMIWVQVVGVTDDTTLNGVVARLPQHATYLKLGDRVEFELDEIEEIQDE